MEWKKEVRILLWMTEIFVFAFFFTDFSKGRLGYKQRVTADDLVRLHGHLCDGLIEGTLALEYGLSHLYPDDIIDRTATRIVSRSVEQIDNFSWNVPLRNDFLKTDILNKAWRTNKLNNLC